MNLFPQRGEIGHTDCSLSCNIRALTKGTVMASRRIDDITRHMTNDDKEYLTWLLLRKDESWLRSFLASTPQRQRSAVIALILVGMLTWYYDAHRQHVLGSL